MAKHLFSVADTQPEQFRIQREALVGGERKILAGDAYTGKDAILGIKCNALDLTLDPHDSSLCVPPIALHFTPALPCILITRQKKAPKIRLTCEQDARLQCAVLLDALAALRTETASAETPRASLRICVYHTSFSLKASYLRRGKFIDDLRLSAVSGEPATAGTLFWHLQTSHALTQLDRLAAVCFQS